VVAAQAAKAAKVARAVRAVREGAGAERVVVAGERAT
jgi:hypothetical protein